MQKLLILAVLVALATCNPIAAPACDNKTNGWDDNGICKYCHWTCKTCSGSGADKCTACEAVSGKELSTIAAGSTGTCGCAQGKFLTVASSKLVCEGAAPSAPACPNGTGTWNTAAQGAQAKTYQSCKACKKNGCAACNDTGDAKTDVTADCGTCLSAQNVAQNECPGVQGKFYINFQGQVDACPAGYFANGIFCEELGAACKVGTSNTVCTECAAGWGLKTDKSCEKCASGKVKSDKTCEPPLPTGCTEFDATDNTKCAKEKCDTTKGWAKNAEAGACACEKHLWKKTTAADNTKTPPVPEKIECAKCDGKNGTADCAAGDTCSTDGKTCTAGTPKVECEDTPLKDSGCTKCAKAEGATTFTCSACTTGTKLGTAGSKACVCDKGLDTSAWDKVNMKCVDCAAKCTGETPACVVDGTPVKGTDSKAKCDKASAAPGAGSGSGSGSTTSNGILISAISMILAVILA